MQSNFSFHLFIWSVQNADVSGLLWREDSNDLEGQDKGRQ